MFVLISNSFGDYVEYSIQKGWNLVGTSTGINNASLVDSQCVSYYSILENNSLVVKKVSTSKKVSIKPNEAILYYSPKGNCKINFPLKNISLESKKDMKIKLKKGWNMVGSNYSISIPSVDSKCVKYISVLHNGMGLTSYTSKQPEKISKLKIDANNGLLFNAYKDCNTSITLSIDKKMIFAKKNMPQLLVHTYGEVNNKINRIKTFEDARVFFEANCIECHSMDDSRLSTTSADLQNKLQPYQYYKKKEPKAMVDYVSSLSVKDMMVLSRYIEELYKYYKNNR